jgi:ribose 5-phosphate isomerase B
MRVLFATDHAGFELKEALVAYVRDELGYEVEDMGAHAFDTEDDYPNLIAPAAKKVAEGGPDVRAVILGGSGQGEAMAANRFPGVRAAVFYGGPREIITLSREHNDANVLSLGARFLGVEDAKAAVAAWLQAPASGEERHVRRRIGLDRII